MLRELFRNYASIRVEIRPTDIISTTTGAKFILQFTEVTSLSGETQMLPNAVRKAQMAVDRNGSEWGQIIWDPHLQ
jgi:hypothetical protein